MCIVFAVIVGVLVGLLGISFDYSKQQTQAVATAVGIVGNILSTFWALKIAINLHNPIKVSQSMTSN